jgi:arylsulfatase A-like enzyme
VPGRTLPNVLLILADDLGYGDLSSYGCPDIRTPHIDRLGRQGVRFTQFYANSAECTPSRAALLSGRYEQRFGGLECAIGVGDVGRYDEAKWLSDRGELGLPADVLTMPRAFKEAGYDTACFGKWHLGYRPQFSPNRHGFDEYFGILGGEADYFTHKEFDDGGRAGKSYLYHNSKKVERRGYLTDLFTDAAIDWLRRRGRKPFFLYLPYTAPHFPIQDPDGFDPKIGTAPTHPQDRHIYAKMVERLDTRVGDVLAQLDARGVADNTIVVFMSDNGAPTPGRNLPLRGWKGTLFEGGIRVPLMVRWPGKVPAGKTSAQVALAMDLFPTLMAAVGARPAVPYDGSNILPVLRGIEEPFRRVLFFWRYKRLENRRKAVRDGDMKYIIDNGKEYVFNLAGDMLEQRNLLPDAEPAAAEMRKKLAAWELEVQAPRLRNFRPQGVTPS